MQRRNFLGLIAAGAAYPLLPTLATPSPAPLENFQIWTAETLAVEMEKMFACRMGPATAFFEVVKGTSNIVEPTITVSHKIHEDPLQAPFKDNYERFIYQTFGFAIEGGDEWEAEHRLAQEFYTRFSQVPQKQLVWRRKPVFETMEMVDYGETWATRESVEDGFVDLSTKPDNVELDPAWGNYRYVTRRYPLHRMSMRLAFTDAKDSDTLIFAREEGAPLPRIS